MQHFSRVDKPAKKCYDCSSFWETSRAHSLPHLLRQAGLPSCLQPKSLSLFHLPLGEAASVSPLSPTLCSFPLFPSFPQLLNKHPTSLCMPCLRLSLASLWRCCQGPTTFADLRHGLMRSPCLGLAALGTPCPLPAAAGDPAASYSGISSIFF